MTSGCDRVGNDGLARRRLVERPTDLGLWTSGSVQGMNRVRKITIGEREVRLQEHALTIGGIPVIWTLDAALFEDGTRVPDAMLTAAGIRHRKEPPEDDWSRDD